jgi:hypothetical protein
MSFFTPKIEIFPEAQKALWPHLSFIVTIQVPHQGGLNRGILTNQNILNKNHLPPYEVSIVDFSTLMLPHHVSVHW